MEAIEVCPVHYWLICGIHSEDNRFNRIKTVLTAKLSHLAVNIYL